MTALSGREQECCGRITRDDLELLLGVCSSSGVFLLVSKSLTVLYASAGYTTGTDMQLEDVTGRKLSALFVSEGFCFLAVVISNCHVAFS